MKTITINTIEKAEQQLTTEIEGNLVINCNIIKPQLNLRVTGDIRGIGYLFVESVISGGTINLEQGLQVISHIYATEDIKTPRYYLRAQDIISQKGNIEAYGISASHIIEANGSVKSATDIQAQTILTGGNIEAGGSIRTECWMQSTGGGIKARYVFSEWWDIQANYLETIHLPFWRNYYAAMPPLQRFEDAILNIHNCWDTLRELAQPYRQEIVAWEGWHPHIKWQLEMFLGLKERVILREDSHTYDSDKS